MSGYRDLVAKSIIRATTATVAGPHVMPEGMREHQRAAVAFALETGRAALFLDTGLGKSLCSFAWAYNVARATGKPVLMLAPLGVVGQHKDEAARFGYDATVCREAGDVREGLNLANYDRLHLFDPTVFGGVILDESSIIKNFSGVTTRNLMAFASGIPFRLCCTATPAPNDHMELGQHCQFLGVMSSSEMLSRWFLADQSEMGRYRLKRHAVKSYWQWVASWARCAEMPSDLGGDNTGYALPKLHIERHIVKTDITRDAGEGQFGQSLLFRIPENSATSIHREKRLTKGDRAAKIAALVNDEPNEAWVIWCETDYDADAVKALLPDAIEVHGRMTADQKEAGLNAFSSGAVKVLISKPSICGFGLNWQHCARQAFVGLSFSYESFYQAVRRCWRYGQTREVYAHVASAETEESIWQAISRKRDDHDTMKKQMRAAMIGATEVRSLKQDYQPAKNVKLPAWLERKAS